MVKNGITQQVSVKHQCITIMKEYDARSFEELRFEDYTVGRKTDPSGATATAGTGLFPGSTTTTNSSLFGSSTGSTGFGTSAFGQKSGATAFGTASAFGTPSTGLFGQQEQQGANLFGQKTTGLFGSTTPAAGTTGFGTTAFGTGSTELFEASSKREVPFSESGSPTEAAPAEGRISSPVSVPSAVEPTPQFTPKTKFQLHPLPTQVHPHPLVQQAIQNPHPTTHAVQPQMMTEPAMTSAFTPHQQVALYQESEMRMAIGKVSDKIDELSSKLSLTTELSSLRNKFAAMEMEFTSVQQQNEELIIKHKKTSSEANKYRMELEHIRDKHIETEEQTRKLRKELKEEKYARKRVESKREQVEEELTDLKHEKDSLEKRIADRKKKQATDKKMFEEELDELRAQHEEDIKALKNKHRKDKESKGADSPELSLARDKPEGMVQRLDLVTAFGPHLGRYKEVRPETLQMKEQCEEKLATAEEGSPPSRPMPPPLFEDDNNWE